MTFVQTMLISENYLQEALFAEKRYCIFKVFIVKLKTKSSDFTIEPKNEIHSPDNPSLPLPVYK